MFTMSLLGFTVLLLATSTWVDAPLQAQNDSHQNIVVFREPNRFAGWPANNGIWSWGNEIVVGFTLGQYKDNPKGGHPIDGDAPQVQRLARSIDGGVTWKIETPSYFDSNGQARVPTQCPGNIDFTQPNFAFMIRMQKSGSGYSHFYWSNDRCKTWFGPYQLPTFDRKGIFSRTDVIVNGKHDLTAFLTAAKEDGKEGRPLVVRTTDGGKSWTQQSWIGAEPGPGGYAIMPSTVRLSPNELLTFIRCRSNNTETKRWWIEPYRSLDDGRSWTLEKGNSIDNAGNPPHLVKLRDGRIALTYGYRKVPYGVRAKISSDGGRTWGQEIILRDDGDSWDLGYPRTVQREDGKMVTVYYFNDKVDKFRYIAGTIWRVPEQSK